MPYTAKQRRRFHAGAARGEPGMKELAAEADAYARKGQEKPAKKTTSRSRTTSKGKAAGRRRGKRA